MKPRALFLFLAFSGLSGFTPEAASAELRLHTVSAHYGVTDGKEKREENPGLGFIFPAHTGREFTFGFYANTIGNTSFYFGEQRSLLSLSSFSLSFTYGAVSGYDLPISPILPMATINLSYSLPSFSLTLSYIPTKLLAPSEADALALSIELPLSPSNP